MSFQNNGVNLNAQKLPVSYQEGNTPALVAKTASKTKTSQNNDSKRVGVVNAPGIPNNPLKDEFSKEKMENPEIAKANQQLIMEAQRRAFLLKQSLTLVGIGVLAYLTLIRKKGFLSIRKHFIKKAAINNADKLKTYTENLLNKKAATGVLNSKEIPKKISVNFSETGIAADAKKEAVENIYKVAKEASLMDDAISKIDVSFSQSSKEEIANVIKKLKEGKINEISNSAINKIEKISFVKKIEKANNSTDILVTPVERELINVSSFSEVYKKAAKDFKNSVKKSFAGDK